MGQNFKGSGIQQLNIDDFAAALRVVYGETSEQLMSYDEAKQVVTEFFTSLEKDAADLNERAGKEFLANNAKQEGIRVTASGLQYQIVKEGTGRKPGPNDVVTVHYTGRLIDGTVFDSTVERGEPATFAVGQVMGRGIAAHERGGRLATLHPQQPGLWPARHRTHPAQQHAHLRRAAHQSWEVILQNANSAMRLLHLASRILNLES